MIDLRLLLTELENQGRAPKVTAYNRIDGPGSSLDLREFQEALWTLPDGSAPEGEDEFAAWSKGLPRTVGITINIGCVVEAHPADSCTIGILSHDYGVHQTMPAGRVPYRKELWLLRVLDAFGLGGVRFDLHNTMPGVKSAGLGGSATATTAVCLLANKLAGARLSVEQIVAMASLLEQDLGVSITGVQEQSNAAYGGVTDYVWFPWGLPGSFGGYGTSIRRTLLSEADYPELAARMRVYHSGRERASTDVNAIWRARLGDPEGYELHQRKPGIAHEFREGLRTMDWQRVQLAIRDYVNVRTELCGAYMTAECWDIQGQCEKFEAESFPLGAGGGGSVMVFCPSPERLCALDKVLSLAYRRIDIALRAQGHMFENLPIEA